ncbi:helix-turn-helix domain-containing protein [Nocardioides okcheonensis]|uniref:helix-turn-helix domain-containing protein n=1 Tax=Nocardioides okcheonensis TaxID=2894081 RepID=UPI001E5BE61E|nr:AraC family transcriptional regulator [Nocardioides okcheonensis]UFN45237.1 AraC family transcriptional regulator [Nocardioides okcheonensis]
MERRPGRAYGGWIAPVHPALTPYVVSMTAYDVRHAASSGVHLGMPSTELTFVLPLDDPLDVSWDGDPSSRTTVWASVSGLHTRAAHIHHGPRQRGIQLALTPAGARALWGVPAAALSGSLLDVHEVDRAWADLPERLAVATSWGERLHLVEATLVEALRRHAGPGPRPEVARAMAMLTRGARVDDTAQDVGFSRRRLSTLVRDEVGVTPKQLQRLARFADAHRRMRTVVLTGEGTVASVAAASGYADQAHLAREWHALAGCSPTEWARREFPNVQAVALAPEEG